MEGSNRRERLSPDAEQLTTPPPPSEAGVCFSPDLISHFSRDKALCSPWGDTLEGRKRFSIYKGTGAAKLGVSLKVSCTLLSFYIRLLNLGFRTLECAWGGGRIGCTCISKLPVCNGTSLAITAQRYIPR